ncbi:pleckstrin-2 isoform X4 [Myotis daubentonii]|uniref:pleckstrin-2 isoform X4 n=1 Tax=Myotis daubentonii TaxID=98922 RepID=UPI002873A5B9|nr:pleckstrin-2 isoform X4 [Myotis daubentonii]
MRRGDSAPGGLAGGDMEDGGVLKEGFLVKRKQALCLHWTVLSMGSMVLLRAPKLPCLVGLARQGHIVHNWKARWFVLRQNTLLYYKLEGGRKVNPPKGQILLDGCTITCPCLEYENRPLLIKLKTRTSTEYFLEACSREDRDAWAFEITGAIHAGQPGKVQQLHIQRNSFKLPPHISLHRIVDKMHDSGSGIRPSPNLEQGSTYKKTFNGSSLVDWLISNGFAANRLEAVTLASMLLEENFLNPVGARSMGAVRSGDLAEQFLDDSTALYTFAESYKTKISLREDINPSTMELSGTVIKQGYLAKQGHKRKNWKVRRFVLRKEPAFLHYYDPSKALKGTSREISSK